MFFFSGYKQIEDIVFLGNEEDIGLAFSLLPRRCSIQAGGHKSLLKLLIGQLAVLVSVFVLFFFFSFSKNDYNPKYPPMVEAKMTPNMAKQIMIIIFFCK